MFKIVKVLNNSAAICRDSRRREYLLMGKGMAFQKKVRDPVDESLVTSRFLLKNKEEKTRLETMVSEIPNEYFELSQRIRLHCEEKLNHKLEDSILVVLTDHIYYAVSKTKRGIHVPNLILNEIRQFYPMEYQLGLDTVKMINETFQIKIPDDEAGFIAFHIVGGKNSDSMVDMNEMVELLNEFLQLIQDFFQVELDRETLEYSRLITHLKFFITRMLAGKRGKEDKLYQDIYQQLCLQYPDIEAFLAVLNQYVREHYRYEIVSTDRMYLMLHLARNLKKDNGE